MSPSQKPAQSFGLWLVKYILSEVNVITKIKLQMEKEGEGKGIQGEEGEKREGEGGEKGKETILQK